MGISLLSYAYGIWHKFQVSKSIILNHIRLLSQFLLDLRYHVLTKGLGKVVDVTTVCNIYILKYLNCVPFAHTLTDRNAFSILIRHKTGNSIVIKNQQEEHKHAIDHCPSG